MFEIDKMHSYDDFVVGECLSMCPDEEMELRRREGLVHVLELPQQSSIQYSRLPCKFFMVKSFSRSAIGRVMPDVSKLRPAYVLMETVDYLITNIVPRDDVPWIVVYEFVTDRFNSIRQDMVIQNISGISYINIMRPIVQFYAYAGYRLCENKKFDAYINERHLQESLKGLLIMYNNFDDTEVTESFIEGKNYFEAMYLIANLGNTLAITRVLQFESGSDSLLKKALDISLNYNRNNYVRVLRGISTLPILLGTVAAIHLQAIRKRVLEIMSIAYSSKNLSFKVKDLKKLLLYDESEDVIADCKYYRLLEKNGGIIFLKDSFSKDKPILPPKRLSIFDEKLNGVDIPELLLTF